MRTEQTGLVFDVQRYCVHDGPGIRTTVFLKGCNLRCFWCHNPESYSQTQDLMFYSNKCIACGKCFELCPHSCHTIADDGAHLIDRSKCTLCAACAKRCFAGALTMSGRMRTTADVMKTVRADAVFYRNSGGGLTVSGGEPMLQSAFVTELFQAARTEGIHTALDTAGNIDPREYDAVLPHTSLILFDLKCMDETVHKAATGVGLSRILENIRRMGRGSVPVWVRVPVILGVNATTENMRAVHRLLADLPAIKKLELLPYHNLGASKYENLGLTYKHSDMKAPSKELMAELIGCFADADYQTSA
ncbi:MAG: glycyl-radical enzyme activating protein [Oscillospiraceae bacterium]|nr:glycyl-radical enzyme activating protein [Oscillospiraceae bacterium]